MNIVCCNTVLTSRKGKPIVCPRCGTKYGIHVTKPMVSRKKKTISGGKTFREVLRDAFWIIIILMDIWGFSILNDFVKSWAVDDE